MLFAGRKEDIMKVNFLKDKEYLKALDEVKKTNDELKQVLQELEKKKEEYDQLIREVRELKKKLNKEHKGVYK